MAYKNIVWVKLERRLLNDHRWYMMSDHAQLLYIKLILLAAETYNKIPKSEAVLIQALRSELEIGKFKGAIQEIQKNFPMFKGNKHFYYFGEFEDKTNWLPNKQSLSKRPAIAQHSVEKKRKDKEKKKIKKLPLSNSEFLESLKTNLVYKHIDLDTELGKMDAWLKLHPGRKKTPRFVLNWINKIEKPIETHNPESKYKLADLQCKTCSGTGFIYNPSKSTNDFCKCRIK